MGSGRRGGPGSVGAGRPGVLSLAVPRSALRRAVGGGRERASEAFSGPFARLAFFCGCVGGRSEARRGWGDGGRGAGKPARLPRGPRSEAEGGMAGLGGSGWEEAVGEGRGRAVTSGRASRRAAATLTLIRCRVTKWRIGPQWPPPRSVAVRERGIRRRGRRRLGRKCCKWPRSTCGLVF